MANTEAFQIVAVYVSFAQGTGGKRRPVLIVEDSQKIISTLSITSKFNNKSEQIKKQYFELLDWKTAGLAQPSWIDIRSLRNFPKPVKGLKKIGALSEQDKRSLLDFIRDYRK